MSRLVIAIDCDDVLVDTLPKIVEDYNAMYGTKLGLEHMYVDHDEIVDVFGVKTGQEAVQRLHKIYQQKGYYESLKPIDGAIGAIAKLAERHELHVVTGRQSFLAPATQYTLDTYFPGMFTSVEHTNYYKDENFKDAITRSKGEVCSQLKADILIDDHVAHGKDVLNHGVREVLLFGDYPWNQSDEIPGVTRCNTWADVLLQVDTISHEA